MTEQPGQTSPDDEHEEKGQVSEAGSALEDTEAATGGADAVPDTPDINPGTPEAMQGE